MSKTVEESLKKFISGAWIIGVGTLIGQGLGYVYKILIARIGPYEFGILSLCFTFLGIASSLSFLGLKSGVVRFVSFYRGKEEPSRIKGTILTAIRVTFLSSIFFGTIAFIGAGKISRLFFHDKSTINFIRFFALLLPVYVINFILLKTIVAFRKIKYRVYIYNMFENLFKIIFTVVLLLIGLKIWAAILGYGASIILCLLISIYFIEFKIFPIFRSKQTPVYNYSELISYSIPLFFSGIMVMLLTWTDTLMIGYFLDVPRVGIYNVALLLTSFIFMGTELFMPLYLPTMTELYAQNKIEEIKKLFITLTKWIGGLSFIIFILLVTLPGPLLKLLFGSKYQGAILSLIILAAGRLIYALSFTSSRIVAMAKRTKLFFAITAMATVVNVILNYHLIPRLGIAGGALATSSALFLQAVLFGIACYYILNVQLATVGPNKK